MKEILAEFTELLRQNGVRISLSESMDALKALALLGVRDRGRFKTGLSTTLIKRHSDQRIFEELFEVFFSGLSKKVQEINKAFQSELQLSPEDFQNILAAINRALEESGEEISAFLRAFLTNDLGEMERLLQNAARIEGADQILDPFQLGFFSRRLSDRLGIDAAYLELERIREAIHKLGLAQKELNRIECYLTHRLLNLAKVLSRFLEQKYVQHDLAHTDLFRPQEDLTQKSFYYYTEEDIRKMSEVVSLLAERLKNRISFRKKEGHKGRLALKATLRSNVQYGGIPFRIRFEKRKKNKPQVVVLCDVSDSVMNASRFMLQFVYSVQEIYSKVRSFIFVRDIGEVTPLFEKHDIHAAVDKAMRGDIIDVFAHSNFGHAFLCFYRDHLETVDKKTTVIIMGDARNNYNPPEDWVLREVRARAKQLIWLNPESKLTWGYGDSEMENYRFHCHAVEECRNVEQLSKIIDRVTLP